MKYWIKFFSSIIFLVAISLFYLWSKLLIVSIILAIIVDSLFLQSLSKTFKKILHPKLFVSLKYLYFVLTPVILSVLIRTFLLDIYYVPSSSMERTLFPGDYVIIDKLSYGVKIPRQACDIPLIGSFFKKNKRVHKFNLYRSLKGIDYIKREDIVVFKSVFENDKFLIKRVIGAPSDTLKIKEGRVYINSKALKGKSAYTYNYIDKPIKGIELIKDYSNEEYEKLSITRKQQLKKYIFTSPQKEPLIFPKNKQNDWTIDNYGEILIPKKGLEITLNNENIDIYKHLILNYENENINFMGQPIHYTFKNNYYFMMGDNRHNSSDSRSYGFVPESYIQGKMVTVFSKERLLN